MSYNALVEKKLSCSRQQVFEALTDFGAIDTLLDGVIDSVTCTGSGIGCLRDIQLSEASGWQGRVVERMDIAYDGRIYGYSISNEEEIPIPMKNYSSFVMIEDTPDGGCAVSYGSNWDPVDTDEDALRASLEGLYAAILDAIEAQSKQAA
ncbi:MAG: SRPBCC family protein [Pseudomonadota bacterium]